MEKFFLFNFFFIIVVVFTLQKVLHNKKKTDCFCAVHRVFFIVAVLLLFEQRLKKIIEGIKKIEELE